MKKKTYTKPSLQVYETEADSHIMQFSQEKPEVSYNVKVSLLMEEEEGDADKAAAKNINLWEDDA